MIINNLTLLVKGRLVKRDLYFEDKILYIKKGLTSGFNGSGLLLVPGLRNAHAHLASRLMKGTALGMNKYDYFDSIGFKMHKKRTKSDAYKSSMLACLEYLKNGVTHVDAMDMDPEPVIKAFKKTGMSYTECIAVKDAHKEAGNPKKQLNKTLKLKKEYGKRIILGLANEYECTPQLMRDGLAFAREHELPIHMHACETMEEVRHMKELTGKRTIEYLHDIGMLDHDVRLAHCTYADSKDVLRLSRHDVPVLHCPTSNHSITGNQAPIKDMLRNNVQVRIGTDIFAWNPSASVLKEAWESHKKTGITIEQAYCLTHQQLAPGMDASFSLIDLKELKPFKTVSELLAKLMNVNAIKSVYVKGKEVIRGGENTLGVKEDKLRRSVEKIRDKILS
ncbi:amidohydrolase family protein [archaeon]|nr:amidohydrolase family protein [archaeon]